MAEIRNNKYINKYIQIRVVVTEFNRTGQHGRRRTEEATNNEDKSRLHSGIYGFRTNLLHRTAAGLVSAWPGHRFPLLFFKFYVTKVSTSGCEGNNKTRL